MILTDRDYEELAELYAFFRRGGLSEKEASAMVDRRMIEMMRERRRALERERAHDPARAA